MLRPLILEGSASFSPKSLILFRCFDWQTRELQESKIEYLRFWFTCTTVVLVEPS